MKCELYHDSFQNWKSYPIQKAQLIIADICIDWDGYRTANELGGLINEIWAYTRYCADKLLKSQEPKLVACEVKRTLQDDSYDVAIYADGVFYNCPKCGKRFSRYRLAKDIKYYSECGQAVKWE